MSFKNNFFCFVASFFLIIPLVLASSNDTQQPITIESNHAELDEKNEISIYTGNVILMQGGIKITADKLTVYANKGELQKITAEGNPVQYFQQRENLEDITGTSQRMEYEADKKRYLLIDHAELVQGKNRFSGQQIQFDPDAEKVIASGGTDDSGQSKQRVQITIQPKKADKSEGNK